ncbi:histidine kinase [Paenibacillus darwinianus]|uniref:histidine kinase n=1 Tax=Paenibacillus darwinianus TaxID=1380763 RepID=A0A9W5W822_9BACL|nr:ATP-binding protein [Paenibacillus darwinianus]EXX91441.1 histidine kinase [Paenibacillus darwinianus]
MTTLDTQTNLMNYESFVTCISGSISEGNEFILALLDFDVFNGSGHSGIVNGTELLMSLSKLLQAAFPDARALARYAGDRFAVLLRQTPDIADNRMTVLNTNSLGYRAVYSLAQYPQDADSTQELISTAEDRLFFNKRALFLKQEEEMMRSEKMKIVGEMAAGMAHEIRNPLTTLKGFLQLSQSQNYNIKPWFDIIMNEITRMNELTGEFLQFSRPGMSDLKPIPVCDVLERVCFMSESQAVSHGHTISLSLFNVNHSLLIVADRDKIVQVLLNIIRNAIEAMTEPGTIHIKAKLMMDELVLEIEDSGPGIPQDELPNIFMPFYTTKESGTGLGLSICHRIVQDHGGRLTVASVVGEGTQFCIRLPVTFDRSSCE